MSINRILSSLIALGVALAVLSSSASAQQTPQNYDDNYTYGNAVNSNAYPQSKPSLIPFNPGGFLPFNPNGFYNKWQLFAPPNTSDFGTGPKPNVGFFFSYQRAYWSISKPERAQIGDPGQNGMTFQENVGYSAVETNTLDTGILNAKGSWGNVWETGFMDTDRSGWLVGVIDHVAQTQDFQYQGPVILFNDVNKSLDGFLLGSNGFDANLNGNNVYGRDGYDPTATKGNPAGFLGFPTLPHATDYGDAVTFIPRYSQLHVYNRSVINGTEIMRMYRTPQLRNNSSIEMLYGARWFQFDDTFQLNGEGGVLDATVIHNRVMNNLVGPQIGTRYAHQRGRWKMNAELRFMAAANFESFSQRSLLASNYSTEQALLNSQSTASTVPILINPATGLQYFPTGLSAQEIRNAPAALNAYGSNHAAFNTKFAPLLEFRLGASYQISRGFALKVGYTGIFTNGVNHASNTVFYSLPAMGIVNTNQRDNLIINGLNMGFEVNR